ncbi:hypothetical protein KFK09_012809 [Dendrobium nobile]|uniref:Uncharacterized protein n=1 Tax=Dendrobium nobile TaxID=94219 RepID=A0A8T3BJW9_DENNO|nr:hypothetical protein KFK09_012809 [Dendrobium nobile]
MGAVLRELETRSICIERVINSSEEKLRSRRAVRLHCTIVFFDSVLVRFRSDKQLRREFAPASSSTPSPSSPAFSAPTSLSATPSSLQLLLRLRSNVFSGMPHRRRSPEH